MLFLIDLFWRLKQKYVFHFEFASKIDLWISGGEIAGFQYITIS